MPLDLDIQDGANVLDNNQLQEALNGTYWVSGWDASLGTGSLEVDIAAGAGSVGTIDIKTTTTKTVDFTGDVDPNNPRKAIISFDDTGTVQKTLGDPEQPRPVNQVREKTFTPSPPASVSGVVITEVWLASGVASLVGADLRDRRVSNVSAEARVPSGAITLWSGTISNIPSGWELCDGTNGTPDLTNRFVVGAGSSYTKDDTGGEKEHTLTEPELPSHTHDVGVELTDDTAGSDNRIDRDSDSGGKTTFTFTSGSVGSDQAHENRPPYFALAYIQKV